MSSSPAEATEVVEAPGAPEGNLGVTSPLTRCSTFNTVTYPKCSRPFSALFLLDNAALDSVSFQKRSRALAGA
jgi:hypothetical protein